MSLRNLARRITPLLTVYLLLVTIGVPLNRVYCVCLDEEWITFTEPKHDCHREAAASTADEVAMTRHCHRDADVEAHTTCPGHDCGDAEALIDSLDADFLVELNAFNLPAGEAGGVQPHATLASPWPRPTADTAVPIRGPDPPPPSGRRLLVAHQTFLI